MQSVRRYYDRFLEVIAAALMAGLTIILVMGFVYRFFGASLVWYDEIASIGLAWLTYYGSALAALRGAHIGFPGIVNAFSPNLRVAVTLLSEAIVIGFFALLAIYGTEVVMILQGSTLVSLPDVSQQLTQSALPVAAVLFIIAELLRLPEVLAAARGHGFEDHELKEALESVGVEAPGDAAPDRASAPSKPLTSGLAEGGRAR
ncbi:TRAP transporter small permease [Xanthobacter tagetidis]|uniref:TRAP transporter small permease protein n=1 Tax=Xanthobacter tagetidis TaxID=60216 RepID=A0A3L7AN12_9HYPH|nr:TRAP transporter small permease [Xanthobacter tagetidis]MBB6308288.1 TRAP-type C4-dicarboxylate transport system permease small subunit [Xanthobacter tagetidis]RLP81893.1 TRAP transporter small permease [Xanthobacter tagetidis]